MKKRLISLVAAAALVGGVAVAGAPQVAKAGTVTVKGDTQATLYGFVWGVYSWNNQMAGNPDEANMPVPDHSSPTYNKVKYQTDPWVTRLGFTFKSGEGVSGRIEGDFFEEGKFRMRRAYVQHNFDNFYVLIGQEWCLEEMFPSISASFTPPAGFDELILRIPQVRVGTKIDLGTANLDLALAFENEGRRAVSLLNSPYDTVDRVTIPAVAGRVIAHIDTNFGSPMEFYALGSVIPVYLDLQDITPAGKNITDDSETSYMFQTGIKVPVSMFTLGANYQYTDGAVWFPGAFPTTPESYYDVNGSVEDTTTNSFNVSLRVTPIPCVTVGGEYDYVQYKNDDAFTNQDKPKVQTYVANVEIKTTKHTILTLEWRHAYAQDFDAVPGLGITDDSFSGDQYYARYIYLF